MMSAAPTHSRIRRDDPRRTLVAFAVAVLLHLLAVGLVLLLDLVHLPWLENRPPPQQVDLRPLSAEQWARNRGALAPESGAPRPPAPQRPPEEKKEQPVHGQVVAVAPGNEQKPEDTKYLAEKNNKVEKETKSRVQTPFYRNAMPKQTAETQRADLGRDAAAQAQLSGNNGAGQDDRPRRQAEKKGAMEIPKTTATERVALKSPETVGPGAQVANRSESAEVAGNSDRLHIAPGSAGGSGEEASDGRKGQVGILNLMPSAAALDKIIGAAPNDHLDAEEGDSTFLNTREWKFATFFNRVKQAVGTHWNPNEPLRQRDPTGNIYGGRDRYTLLSITLDAQGSLRDVHVEKSCGVDFLDEAAIAAFQKSQPFPNPPPGLVDKDNAIRFQFGFFLEFGGGPRMRLFRNN
ncbi:MAG: energy transducer TonB [Myxococcaceae bacterium]